jgi:TetR/AcrR family transcriptional regulator, mexJK operon transcriptional repressor
MTDETDRTPTETRILDAARALFFTEGFGVVTTDRLCREASVSKTSLYKYFGDMGGVLAAVVKREGDAFTVGVDARPETPEALRAALVAYGTNLLTLLNQPFCVQFDQMMHEEARSRPEVARLFYDAAYGRSHREITALLADACARGLIRAEDDPAVLADNLISMWEGLGYVRTRLGLQARAAEEPSTWAAHCVRMLFSAVAADPSRP